MSTYASLRHAKWDGKSHIVFVPKGRKKELYGNIRKFLGPVFHELAAQRRSQMLEGHMVQDHVHMLIRIPPQYSVAEVVGYIKGQSAIAVARQCGGRKRKFNGEALWARGYAVSTVGFEAEQMRRYITNQDQLDGQGKDEDGDFSGSLRSLTWQPLGLLTTVKPPALRERPDSADITARDFATYPHHKHVGDIIEESTAPSLADVLAEIVETMPPITT
jgi:putative transposase